MTTAIYLSARSNASCHSGEDGTETSGGVTLMGESVDGRGGVAPEESRQAEDVTIVTSSASWKEKKLRQLHVERKLHQQFETKTS